MEIKLGSDITKYTIHGTLNSQMDQAAA